MNVRRPDERDHVEIDAGPAAGVSDRGLRHAKNEDAMAVVPLSSAVVAVVCDGVSSSSRPEEASQAAADTAARVLAGRVQDGADAAAATREAVEEAARAVEALSTGGTNPPACTYVSAVIDAESVTVGWLGDSRVYWVPADGLADGMGGEAAEALTRPAVLTVDDSLGGPEFVSHLLTGWLGADALSTEPHVETFRPGGPGLVVVCSDGLWNYLRDPAELAAAVSERSGPPLQVAQGLVELALERGGHDNITVVVVPFPPPAGAESG